MCVCLRVYGLCACGLAAAVAMRYVCWRTTACCLLRRPALWSRRCPRVDLCWCDCLGTAFYGPHCADAAPPPVMCGASPGAPQVSVPVTSENDRYYKVRLCDSPTHTCGGPGQPPYVDCAEWLPPRQTAGLSIPNATTLLVFVDPECATIDYEVWRPPSGWGEPILVRALCATHVHPLGCGHFPARECAAAGGSVLVNALCQNATTNVCTQCDVATCCATTRSA